LASLDRDLDAANELIVGRGIAYLLLRTRDWVHRRVEFIHFLDAENVQRQMSVDFTLPTLAARSVAELFRVTGPMVPVASLQKERLQRFSVWAEDGQSVPMLTANQNGRLAGACLVSMATDVLGADTSLPDNLARVLREIAAAPSTTAAWILEELRDRPERLARRLGRLRGLMLGSNVVQARPRCVDLLIGLAPHAELVSRLLADGALNAMAEELAQQFIMVVPLESDSGRRRVLKFNYEEPVRSKRRGQLLLRPAAQVLESVGFKARRVDFDRLGVGHAESHHVEIAAPQQLEFIEATLKAVDQETDERYSDAIPRGELTGERVHLYQRGRSRSTLAAVRVRLRAEFIGLPLTAPALASLTAAVLLIGDARTAQLSKEAGAALLLIGPTLLAAFLVRPGEHPMATRLLLGVRALVVLSGLCSLVAAAALAGQYEAKLPGIWRSATVCACAVAGVLLVGLVMRPGSPQTRVAAAVLRSIGRLLSQCRRWIRLGYARTGKRFLASRSA
jgi:hypothetical protein